jgi:hypothetical protein
MFMHAGNFKFVFNFDFIHQLANTMNQSSRQAYSPHNYWVFGLCPSSGILSVTLHRHKHLEAYSRLASYEICGVLWNREIRYRFHKSPAPVPIVNQMKPVHNLLFYLFRAHFNIIPRSTPRSSKGYSLLKFFDNNYTFVIILTFPFMLHAHLPHLPSCGPRNSRPFREE